LHGKSNYSKKEVPRANENQVFQQCKVALKIVQIQKFLISNPGINSDVMINKNKFEEER
jgi:hypothetical protein